MEEAHAATGIWSVWNRTAGGIPSGGGGGVREPDHIIHMCVCVYVCIYIYIYICKGIYVLRT